ncbi:MAG TPA: GDP-mannose 4,6-dehydratase [Acidimicrobiales bacterium]|nr:GDP-mannose 4,6-dehydratase [Acidimicrobiales bacterium]
MALPGGPVHRVSVACANHRGADDVAFARAGLNYLDHVVIDEAFFRPAEVDLLVGDPKKASSELGWAPEVDFAQLVEMMVDADLAALE